MGKVAAISESEKIVNDDESNANIENQKIPNKPVLEATSSNSPTTPPAIPPRTYPQQPSSTNSDVIVARRRPLWQQLIIVSMITELGKDTSEILSLKFSTSSTTSSLEPSLLTTLSTDLTSMAEKLKAHQEFENPKEEINEIQDSLGSLVTYLSSTINTPSGLMIDKDLDASQIKKEIRSIKGLFTNRMNFPKVPTENSNPSQNGNSTVNGHGKFSSPSHSFSSPELNVPTIPSLLTLTPPSQAMTTAGMGGTSVGANPSNPFHGRSFSSSNLVSFATQAANATSTVTDMKLKRRSQGRIQKLIADLYLMAGRLPDAVS
ncbi:10085_t:CDS:2, partial [Entrophospora sp. SA101]